MSLTSTPNVLASAISEARDSTVHELDARLIRYSLDAVTDMIIWLDRDGRYVFCNKAATEFLGYTSEELRQLRVCDVDPNFDETRWHAHWKELEEQGSVRLETVNTTKNGQNLPIEVNATFVCFDGKQYNCSIVRNITDRKRVETELIQLNHRVYQLSITDALTGIANRRHFDDILAREFKSATLLHAPLSLVLLDIDHFKAFNDHYGHLSGDHCLRRVAAAIVAAVRQPNDLTARYGGEEFVCILPGMQLEGAILIGERIRQAIMNLAIPHAASPQQVVTASLGVVSTTPSMQSATDMLAEVDRLLYQAKREGRNRLSAQPTTYFPK
ncbi:GGDEF domain-containing protein [uncultured Oxalicibacterium sp.]|uniref:GGDEF domain-containing protein n=1 Tax=uncultured Oxalicibacterium sp. TaxID=1168540 RepID=UPI0025FFDA94|nr:GGDEF domain-containing protein [uncultured Oxalicibacterium sp.]